MSAGAGFADLTSFRVPAVRHLAWMCHAPQLLDSPLSFAISAALPAQALSLLQCWDQAPESGPTLLTAPANPRLGFYFEALYECLLSQLLGWEVLQRNIPIREAGISLGELDFVVRNPGTGQVEHHEIAVKFYLGYPEPGAQQVFWYGPNQTDRLDLKSRRILEQQSQRTHLDAASTTLAQLGLKGPLRSRVFMPGYLFYPQSRRLASPLGVPRNHERGSWIYWDEALQRQHQSWVQLRKPHWLGPWVQEEMPDAEVVREVLEQIELTQTPRLFAGMRFDSCTHLWCEQERFFVVPSLWPNDPRSNINPQIN
jgi:hypothetical protein